MAELKFSQSHEWANIDGAAVTVGISGYAQKELGDIVFVELPRIGDKVKQGNRFGTIESTKAASELYAPLSGTVTMVNGLLNKVPQLINESPLDKGWMVKIRTDDPAEAGLLMNEAEYNEFIAKEK